MKKSIVFSILAIATTALLMLACKKSEQTVIIKNTRGYNCVNYTCTLVEENAQYITLNDCKGDCGNNNPGTVSITSGWGYPGANGYYYPSSVETAVAYSSNDLAAQAYIRSSTWTRPGSYSNADSTTFALIVGNLTPGIYYYSITSKYAASYDIVHKSSPFTVKPGETTKIYVRF